MSTLNLQVGASTDDCMEVRDTTVMDLTFVCNDFGAYGARHHVGLRFTSVSGLSGATINSAILTFRADATDSGYFIGDWFAHDAEAPGTFTTDNGNLSGRSRTTATCEGDGVDFGNWVSGQDHEFTGDGVNTIADIIQELADSYDPSAIVLLHIYVSGLQERRSISYDSSSETAPKLDIDFEAAGGVEITPTVHNYAWGFPTPTFTPGEATFTPDALVYGWAIPTPVIVAGVLIEPSTVVYGWAIPTPTWSGITIYTPSAVTYGWAFPTPSVVAGVSIEPSVLAYGWSIPTPTFTPGLATFTPTAVTLAWQHPTPSVTAGAVSYQDWGVVTRSINTADFPDDAQYYLEAVMETSSAAVPAYARLWNVTGGVEVADSEVNTDGTTPTLVRSSVLALSGTKTYRVQFGGEPGSQITGYAAAVVVETN